MVSVAEEEVLDHKRVLVAEEEAIEDEIISVVEEYEALKDRLIIDRGTHTEDNEEIFRKHARMMTNFHRSHRH